MGKALFIGLGLLLFSALILACSGSNGRSLASIDDIKITAYQGQDVLGGKEVNLSKLLANGKPVVLNLWAGQCPPCRAEMPDFQQVADAYKGQIILVGLDVGPFVGLGTRDDAKQLLQDLKITYPVGTTFDSKVIENYQIVAMPTTFFLKPNGEVYRKWTGYMSRDRIEEMVKGLLEASKSSQQGL